MSLIRIMPCCVVLVASTVRAEALITLSPANPGPYFGGETFPVDVFVTTSQTFIPRLIGFDFSQTNPSIHLSGPDGPDHDTTPEFVFDFSSAGMPGAPLYSRFPNLPLPQAVYYMPVPMTGFTVTITSGVPYHAGNVIVTLPTEPGTYTLDAANYLAEDVNHGASIYFDFANTQVWSTVSDGNVEITGGTYEFVVAPEPATLILLTIGGLAVARRPRKCADVSH